MSVAARQLVDHTPPPGDPTPIDIIDRLGGHRAGTPEPDAWIKNDHERIQGRIEATNCDQRVIEEVNNVPVIECPNSATLATILANASSYGATMIVHRLEHARSGKGRYGYLTFLHGAQVGIDATLHHARQTLLANKRRAVGIAWVQIG